MNAWQDRIVHLPPVALGYMHVRNEVYYDARGHHRVCKDAEDKRCADQYTNVPDMVARHSGDHCASSLAPNGNFCHPSGC